MTPIEQVFDTWAPRGAVWSPWAKPVLFAYMRRTGVSERVRRNLSPVPAPSWVRVEPGTAWVLDIPGVDAVRMGVAMATKGLRPVPLFNATPGPTGGGVVRVDLIADAMHVLADALRESAPPVEGEPVFLLDADRMGRSAADPGPGAYDNRSMVFEQDFPSATFLKSRRIDRVVVVHEKSRAPAADLSYVLRRWQDAGIVIEAGALSADGPPERIHVHRPMLLGWAIRRAMAMLGFRRNSAGGFGAVVPVPGEGGGGGVRFG